ncbi:MAG TPA: 2-dehydropantoate 2-reductase N-terminal domain-containing protein [Anaeromyxobacteraceae bacterium]|nr:2-dehydropantoate 2-reductase N-terminal domain-containing protein [Anaeromyxobacteraceae bacterium]
MKILVVGAGVVGSFNAARLKDAAQDVTLLARGQRLADLREHGVVLEQYPSGTRTTTRVPLIERLGPEDAYDLVLVVVRRNQIPSVLPMLARNRRSPNVLFLGNNGAGAADIIDALGRERVLIGFVNAGGERKGHVVRYIWTRRLHLLLGEVDGLSTPRTQAIASMFRTAGLPARVHSRVDAYLKTHAAGLAAFAGALYRAGGRVRLLARKPEDLKLFLRAYREALRALGRIGVPLRPWFSHLIHWLPERFWLLVFRLFFDTELAVVGGEGHANAAPDEMKEIADELRALFRRAAVPSPASDILFTAVDDRFETWRSEHTTDGR